MEGTFNLHETVNMVLSAMYAVICNILFWAAVHGLAIAVCFGVIGFILFKRKIAVGRPFMSVCRKLCIACGLLSIPGLISLITTHALPQAGVANVNSMAFIVFWSLICVHLSAEEMNHRWFKPQQPLEGGS
ncbi:MAG TPA: hypothetical protein V6C86_23640 [Oculatellaceae cyanobacterium]